MITFQDMTEILPNFLDRCSWVGMPATFAVICPSLKQAVAEAWPLMTSYADENAGCTVHPNTLSLHLPNGAQVRCLGAKRLSQQIRGLNVSGAMIIDCSNHEEIVSLLARQGEEIEQPEKEPAPRFGL